MAQPHAMASTDAAASLSSSARAGAVDRRLSYAVARAEHAIRGRLDAELSAHGLTITQYSVLRLLADDPGATGTELATRTLVTQQAVAHLLGKLERAGLVHRPHSQKRPGRAVPFALTPAGHSTLTAAELAVSSVEAQLRTALAPDQQAALLAAADALTAVGDAPADPARAR